MKTWFHHITSLFKYNPILIFGVALAITSLTHISTITEMITEVIALHYSENVVFLAALLFMAMNFMLLIPIHIFRIVLENTLANRLQHKNLNSISWDWLFDFRIVSRLFVANVFILLLALIPGGIILILIEVFNLNEYLGILTILLITVFLNTAFCLISIIIIQEKRVILDALQESIRRIPRLFIPVSLLCIIPPIINYFTTVAIVLPFDSQNPFDKIHTIFTAFGFRLSIETIQHAIIITAISAAYVTTLPARDSEADHA